MPKLKKFTKKEKDILKSMWEEVKLAQYNYNKTMAFIEERATHKLNIPIEIFHVDGYAVGFGDCLRQYELLDMGIEMRKTTKGIKRVKKSKKQG